MSNAPEEFPESAPPHPVEVLVEPATENRNRLTVGFRIFLAIPHLLLVGGPAAAGLARKPADLTGISERNGGAFPLAQVISTIDGYTRAEKGQLTMPEFGVMLEDQPTVMVDTGDGILTPTPEPLLALAEYLRTLQK